MKTCIYPLLSLACLVSTVRAVEPCKIVVVDKSNGWPVPLVQLTTTGGQSFYTDNAGVVAFDAPEFMNRETYLTIFSHGYERAADGFGYRGVRFTPTPGGEFKIEIDRKQIAKRLGRLTGAGQFAESQKLGEYADWQETGAVGTDTVRTTEHNGKLYWLWGDTNIPNYPLGIYNTPVATTRLKPLASFQPPVAISYEYVRNEKGAPRGTIDIPGPGPVWLSAFVSLPDAEGKNRLVATWAKIPEHLKAGEIGLSEWNEETQHFDVVSSLWKSSAEQPNPPKHYPDGHALLAADADGKQWVYFNGPPSLKCPPNYEAWKDPAQWQPVKRQTTFKSAGGGETVTLASGDIAWSEFRKRWIFIFQEKFGKSSAFGEVWYCEGKSPEGPWGPAVKIATHENYTFYNIQVDWQLTEPDQPFLLFEGTYTHTFSATKVPTPRYDYNQVLYRVDLNDEALQPAQQP